jgi:dipeptidyl aminopeptidase/acylaminoacyl peptidase
MNKTFMNKLLLCFVLLSMWSVPANRQLHAQQAVIAPNENLIAQGIPEVPATIAERAGRYTEYRSAGVFDWHPTQREMLIGTRFADTVQVHKVTMPGGARTQLTFFADRVAEASFQPHKGTYFIFSKDVGGGEWFQYYRFDLASGDITLLTDGKSRNLSLTWSNTGDRVAYASTRRNRTDMDFYIMNPQDKTTDHMIAQNAGGGWAVEDWSPDDKTLLAVEEISVNESHLWLGDAASGKKTALTPEGEKGVAYSPVGFGADGRGVYVTTDRDNEFQRLAYIDLATKQTKYLTAYKWDVESARLSWNRKLIALSVNENGNSVVHVLDLATNKELKLPAVPVGVIGGINWRENNREIGFSINSPHSPGDVYSLDVVTGKLERWTKSETGGLDAEKFAAPELVKWKSFDGLELSGWLFKPASSKAGAKLPVIVNIHGGPEGQARPLYLGRSNYLINELGVAILMPNVRGSTGFGKTFVAMDNGFKREDSYKDIGALFDYIATRPDLDAKRVMVTGGSYGGHMTLAISTRYADRIACSVDVVGMSNLRTFLENTEAYRRDLRRVEYGDERDPKMREFLERIAPMNHVKDITKPIFVIQGANDPRVPKSEADQIVAGLRQQGTPVWYLVAKDEGHGFGKKKNADFQFYATVLFIQQNLLR